MSDEEAEIDRLIAELRELGGDPLRRMARAMVATHVGFEVYTVGGNLGYVNAAWTHITGYSREDAAKHSPADLLRSDNTGPEVYDQLHETVARGETWRGALMASRSDGSSFPQQVTLMGVIDGDGALVGGVGVRTDLSDTALQHVEGQLQMRRADIARWRFGSLLTDFPEPMLLSDWETGDVLVLNEHATKLFGYDPSELDDIVARQLVHVDHHDAVHRFSARLREVGFGRLGPIPHVHRDGTVFWGELSVVRVRREGSDFCLTMIRNVTSERQDRLDLEQGRRLASLGRMAAAVAHDVNNPAAVLKMSLSSISDVLNSDQPIDASCRADLLRVLHEADARVDRIAQIVANLQSTGQPNKLACRAVSVPRVVSEAVAQVRHLILEHVVLDVIVEPCPDAAGEVTAYVRVLGNLLSNAAKIVATREGPQRVTVRAGVRDEMVFIEVIDTGPGLPLPLEQLITAYLRRATYEGSGLGLWIAADLLKQHGGRLRAWNRGGTGAQFVMEMPIWTASEHPVEASLKQERRRIPKGTRVLVVDDDSGVAKALSRILSRRCEVTVELEGRAALERIEGGERFDVILCDLMMPEFGGREFHTQLSITVPEQGRRTVIVTGGAVGARSLAFMANFDGPVITKPIDLSSLRGAMWSIIESAPPERRQGAVDL